jgi:hypothetical protein
VLDPRRKTRYFHQARWKKEWIDTAKEMLHDSFATSYWKFTPDPFDCDDDILHGENNGADDDMEYVVEERQI